MKIIYWKDDPAARNIVSFLEEFQDIIIRNDKSLLYTESIEEVADFFVVPSTHRSESGQSSLTIHATGNWGKADFGGREHELDYTWPAAIRVGLKSMKEANVPGYEVAMEVTHHGPTTIGKPLVFIEIGSGEAQWKDRKAGKAVADAIRAIYENRDEFENYIGFGGIHYAPSFTNVVLENENVAVGHIAPKYASEFLDKEIIEQALKKGFAEKAMFDWKGIRSEPRQKAISALEELGVAWTKTSEMH